MKAAWMVSAFVVLALSALALALAMGASDQADLDELARQNCEQVEALKTEFRDQAVESFANLDRNVRLLGIELTPEAREVAKQGRDATLRRFAPTDC